MKNYSDPLKLFCLFHKLTTAKVSLNVALTVNVTTTPVYPKSFREIIIIIIDNLLFNQYTPEHHLLISLACLLVRMLILTSPGFSRAANTDRSYNKLHIAFVPQCLLLKRILFLICCEISDCTKLYLLALFMTQSRNLSQAECCVVAILYCERNAEHIYKGRRN